MRRTARSEYDAAVVWYENEKPGLGDQLIDEVDRVLEIISEHPRRISPAPARLS
jgi:hypothetical protein